MARVSWRTFFKVVTWSITGRTVIFIITIFKLLFLTCFRVHFSLSYKNCFILLINPMMRMDPPSFSSYCIEDKLVLGINQILLEFTVQAIVE